MSAAMRCRKPGCGASVTTGHPCTDYDCPERFVSAIEYQALEKSRDAAIATLQAEVARTADQLEKCAALLEVMAENAQARGDTVEWAMMSVMAKDARVALGGSDA